MQRALSMLLFAALSFGWAPSVQARDVAGELRRYIGYSVVQVTTVARVSTGLGGKKILQLQDGGRYLVTGLVPPAPFTEVAVFARKTTSGYLVMLVIGDQAYDAEPMN